LATATQLFKLTTFKTDAGELFNLLNKLKMKSNIIEYVQGVAMQH